MTVALRTGLNNSDAEDCAQHTWISLYKNRNKIADPLRLPSWLIKTTNRRAMRIIHNRNRDRLILSEYHETKIIALADEEIIALEIQAELEVALNMIDKRCRILLYELFLADEKMNYRDIAKKLNITFNSIGPTRMRCLKKLKKILSELGYE